MSMKVYSRRKALLNSALPPDGYKWLDYIENTSSAYIDTLLAPGSAYPNFILTMDMEVMTLPNDRAAVYGTRWRENDSDSNYIYIDPNNRWNTYIGGNKYITSIPVLGRHTVGVNNRRPFVDGVNFTTMQINHYGGGHIVLLGIWEQYNKTVISNRLHAKIYSCQASLDSKTLVRDYKPIQRLSDGKVGLWDNVSKSFFTSPNGVNFVGGVNT